MTTSSAFFVTTGLLAIAVVACGDEPPTLEEYEAALTVYKAQQPQQGSLGDGGTCRMPLTTNKASCDQCLQARCCQLFVTCGSDQQCPGLYSCIGQCQQGYNAQKPNANTEYQQCQQACGQRYPAGVAKYVAVEQCFTQQCGPSCG